jgi:DNA polymerase III subunit alpha
MADSSSVPQFRLRDAAPATSEEKLAWEKEFLGLYLSGHPLDNYRAILSRFKLSIAQAKELHEGTGIVIAGLLTEAKQVFTKNGEAMLFLRIADFSDTLEVVVFPRVFKEYASVFAIDAGIAIKGKISSRNGTKSVICEGARPLRPQSVSHKEGATTSSLAETRTV